MRPSSLALLSLSIATLQACGLDVAQERSERTGAALVDPCRPSSRETIFGECAPTGASVADDPNGVTLGVRFVPTVSGEIRGVRFYRGNTGFPPSGFPVALWSSTGAKLAGGTATIGQNPGTGWMTGPLNTNVKVKAGEPYVATYFAQGGNYTYQHHALDSAFHGPRVYAQAEGGVYGYGAAEAFPSSTYLGSNYFVDVTFIPDAADPCRGPGRETLFGDCPPAEAAPAAGDTASVNLGVRFQPLRAGRITGVRFYRSTPFPVGGFPVALWSKDGALLSSGAATIGQNPSTGWMTGPLNQEVPVQAGETYVASYRAPAGQYEYRWEGLASPFTAPALTALASGGAYAYGASLLFPTETYRSSNYFVDVVFLPSP